MAVVLSLANVLQEEVVPQEVAMRNPALKCETLVRVPLGQAALRNAPLELALPEEAALRLVLPQAEHLLEIALPEGAALS